MPCRKHTTCTTISMKRLKIRITCNLGHITSAAYTYIFSCLEAMKKAEEDNSSKLLPPKLITFSMKKSAA